jgi:hypothetical protein
MVMRPEFKLKTKLFSKLVRTRWQSDIIASDIVRNMCETLVAEGALDSKSVCIPWRDILQSHSYRGPGRKRWKLGWLDLLASHCPWTMDCYQNNKKRSSRPCRCIPQTRLAIVKLDSISWAASAQWRIYRLHGLLVRNEYITRRSSLTKLLRHMKTLEWRRRPSDPNGSASPCL